MEEWKEYKLKDFLLIPIRNGLTKPSAIRGKGVKMIGMKEIFAMDYIRSVDMDRVPVTDKEYESSEILKYDLLFARQSLSLEGAGKCGIVVSVDEPTVFESHLIRLRIDTKKANPFFIYYYYKSSIGKNQIKSLVQQVAAAGIRGKELIELGLKVPHIEKQNQIANILRVIDNKIEVNRQINDNLEQQAQALFKSWFVDFEPFRDQPFVESELGMIPEGWRVIELEETCTIRYGKGLGKKDLTQDGFPVFGGNGIIGFYTHFLYELPQILVSCRGAASGKIIESLPKSYVTSNSLVLELKDRSYYNYIKLLLLNNPLYDYATGSAQPQITIDNIKGIKIILPLKEVINKVNHTLENIGSIQRNNNEESRRLAELRDTLLPRLMSGEIKVEDVTL